MSFLVRKFSKAKWASHSENIDNPFDIISDAISIDLRTRGNTLSVWRIPDASDQHLDDAVLALACMGDKIEGFDILWIPEIDIPSNITLHATTGNTHATHLKDTHRDLAELNYYKLGLVAELMHKFSTTNTKKYTTAQVKAILNEALKNGKLESSKIDEKLLNKCKN